MSDNAAEITLRGTPLCQAPGKLFLIGEYAVLEGGTAVLTAVSRYAVGQHLPGAEPASPLVAETQREAQERLVGLAEALPSGAVLVDTSQFQQDARKLGLGSSAAVAAAVAGTLLECVGRPVAAHREELYEIADAGHRAAQGGVGSGADVAASVYGGYIRYSRAPGGGRGRAKIAPLAPPGGLALDVFWSGAPASTPDLVRRVRAFGQARPEAYEALVGELSQLAEGFAAAFARSDTAEIIAAARAYSETLQSLGEAAATPIVTPAFAAAAEAATQLGGAAKPSGAGGGDIGIAFFADPDAAAAFAAARPSGLAGLVLDLGAPGAQRRALSFDPGMFQNFKKD